MKYGYARVSTEGQHLEAQVAQLTQAGVDQIFKEKYTGTTTERPVFGTLLKTLQPHDMLIHEDRSAFSQKYRRSARSHATFI